MALLGTPPEGPVVDAGGNPTPGWRPWFSGVSGLLIAMTQSGTTAQRPTKFLWTGRPYLDTTLGKPIWYYGGWIDATGAAV